MGTEYLLVDYERRETCDIHKAGRYLLEADGPVTAEVLLAAAAGSRSLAPWLEAAIPWVKGRTCYLRSEHTVEPEVLDWRCWNPVEERWCAGW